MISSGANLGALLQSLEPSLPGNDAKGPVGARQGEDEKTKRLNTGQSRFFVSIFLFDEFAQ